MKPKLPSLADFRTPRDIMIPRDLFEWYRRQQREGHLSIKPQVNGGCIVALTESGAALLERGGVGW